MAKLKLPLLLINCKTYESAVGKNAVELAKICDKVSKDTGVEIALSVQAADIYPVSQAVSIPIFAQHIDSSGYGSHTGSILPENVKENGASGTLLNHSEKRIGMEAIKAGIEAAKKAGLTVVVCAQDDNEGKEIASFNPDLIAVEPPELIGGDISVSTAKPELISDSVEKIGDILLVGAGVKNSEDVRKSIELGAKGVLAASGVTKAEDPEKVLRGLVSGITK